MRTRARRRSTAFGAAVAVLSLLAGACGATEPSETASPATTSSTTVGSSTTTAASSPAGPTTAVAPTEPPPTRQCTVGAVPATADLDPFYTQGCDLDGFWVVAASGVDPGAIEDAGEFVSVLFANDPELARVLRASNVRLGIIGRDQRTTEMPEYRDLYEAFPETDWDTRARGLGATVGRPLVSTSEENVLCLTSDLSLGEDILLHEFAHLIHEFGYRRTDLTFENRLDAAYLEALAGGVWAHTYATENPAEYWAEAVQSYFGRNLSSEVADGVHGPIGTRAELAAADPALFALIEEKLGQVELPRSCHD